MRNLRQFAFGDNTNLNIYFSTTFYVVFHRLHYNEYFPIRVEVRFVECCTNIA